MSLLEGQIMAATNADLLTLARQLPIPVPWDRRTFVENFAHQRGRPIRLIPTDTAAFIDSPCGLWLIKDDEDIIVHEAGTTDYHIDQIVCHEIGHMVLEHRSGPREGNRVGPTAIAELCRSILPDLEPALIRTVLGRTDYADEQERDAERFASVLMLAAAEAAQSQSMMRSAFLHRR
ncbi:MULTISPECIES: hypothetical protein [Bacteria]|nr:MULTISPECIES: hypothetical protein [Bacteria]